MPRQTEATILKDYCLDLLLLPRGSRNIAKVTVTVAEAAVAGDRTIALSSSSNTTIKAGTALSFGVASGRRQVLFTEDAAITATAAEFDVAPLLKAIAANSEAEMVVGVLPLGGVMTLDLQTQETQVDSTDFQSGAGTDIEIIRNARSYSVSGKAVAGDEALETIVKPLCLEDANINQEVFAVGTMPNGQKFAGIGKITALNLPGNQSEIEKYSFTLSFQGTTFKWTSAYNFD